MQFAVLASGAGSTADFLLQAQARGELRHRLVQIVTDNPAAGVLTVAKNHGVSRLSVSPKDFSSFNAWDLALTAGLCEKGVDFVLLAGFLKKIGPEVLRAFNGRMINTHPSLLPKYGGQGMYGRRVHEAVLKAREKVTGVSIHLVNENFDEGRVLHQVRLAVDPRESVDALETRVKHAEKAALLEFLNGWTLS